MPELLKKAATFILEMSFIFTVVHLIHVESFISILFNQNSRDHSLNSILLVGHVQETIILYFFAFQLSINACVINQTVLYLKNGGSGSLT